MSGHREPVPPGGRALAWALLVAACIFAVGAHPASAQTADSTAAGSNAIGGDEAAGVATGSIATGSDEAGSRGGGSSEAECRSVRGSEVLTREDIIAAGLVRLSDVLSRADRWHAATIDGYTWHAQTAGLAPLSNPRWDVLIDGVPASIGLLGTKSLDALPIHITDIECVELVSRPHVAAGALRQSGTLHIKTRRPDPGVTLGGSVAARNEINDPGPFAYTPQASPNIDRIGPIGSGFIEARSKGRYARASVKLDEFHFTDQQVERRAKVLFDLDPKPRITTRAVAVSGGIESQPLTQRILAGRSETNDLLFFETFGVEIPAIRRMEYAQTVGHIRYAGGALSYHAGYVEHELGERQNAAGIDLGFGKRVITGGAQSQIGTEPLRVTMGGSLDLIDALTDQRLSDRRTTITRLFGLIESSLAGLVDASLFGSWVQVDEQPLFAVMPSLYVTLPRDMWIGASTSVSRRTLTMDETLWRWTEFGYALPDPALLEDDPLPGDTIQTHPDAGRIDGLGEWPAPRLVTADLEFGGRPWRGVEVTGGAYLRRSFSDYLARHDLTFVEDSTGFRTRTRLHNYVSGQVIGVHASVRLRLLSWFQQQLTYVAENVHSDDLRYYSGQAPVPSHTAALTATIAPSHRFSLYARARYQASSTWPDFAASSAASGGFYPWVMPHRILLDVAATKRLWRDHIVANISIRNLLNEEYRSHPAGAIFDMSFHFAVRVAFNSESGL